jgi:hypothetical protein
MEYVAWFIALGVSGALLISLAGYLFFKLLRLQRSALALQELLTKAMAAANSNPEVVALVSAIAQDPVIHEAARRKLLASRRRLKARETRRLASRVFKR